MCKSPVGCNWCDLYCAWKGIAIVATEYKVVIFYLFVKKKCLMIATHLKGPKVRLKGFFFFLTFHSSLFFFFHSFILAYEMNAENPSIIHLGDCHDL